jgi:Uncharacterized conserved protein
MEITIKGIDEKEKEKIEDIIKTLIENKDAIKDIIEIVQKLQESGILSAVSGLLEGFEEGFNSIVKPEIMGSVANAMMLVWLIGNLNHQLLFELAQKLPEGMKKATEEFSQAQKEKPSIFKMLKLMKSPEFYAAIKSLHTMIRYISNHTNSQDKK